MFPALWNKLDEGYKANTMLHEEDILSTAIALEREWQPSVQADAKEAAAAELDKEDGRTTRRQESEEQKVERLLSDEYLNTAFGGDYLQPGGKLRRHGTCKRPLKRDRDGSCALPCHHNVWPLGKEELSRHLQEMANRTQAARTQWVYERLVGEHYADVDADGNATGQARWHYRLMGREVCLLTFCSCHGIGTSSVYAMQTRLLNNCKYAHARLEEGAGSSNTSADGFERVDYKAMSVIAWTQVYAEDAGDWMPEREELVIPLRLVSEEYAEYACGRTDPASPEYFAHVRRTAPELSHIRHARTCYNFQKCTTCMNDNAELAAAIATGSADRIARAKAKRAIHHLEQRGERLAYYARRERGSDASEDRWCCLLVALQPCPLTQC